MYDPLIVDTFLKAYPVLVGVVDPARTPTVENAILPLRQAREFALGVTGAPDGV
jgi:hypothetical protein